DRVQHGGYKQGASHINAKLNQGQVESVRKKRASGSKVKDLAKEFAVSTSTIELVLYGKSYKVNQGGAS
ncbi:MAG: HNH endonuclease, partial [Acinetobacter baumannii]|nr:HNH endonuclease [Acinetobacter baumannii]